MVLIKVIKLDNKRITDIGGYGRLFIWSEVLVSLFCNCVVFIIIITVDIFDVSVIILLRNIN